MFNQIGARLSAMMFIQFFIWGAWYVTVGNYMGEAGLDKAAVGNAYSVGPIAAILSPFILGMIADRFFATERVLGVLHILGGAAIFCAPMMVNAETDPSGTWFLLMLLVHMLCYMPTLGLTNTLAFHNMTDNEKQFPLIRVFGTIGWIVAGIVVSKVLKADMTAIPLQVAGAAGIVMGIYSFTLPHTPPPSAGKKVSVRDVLGLDALVLLKNSSFVVFIVCSFLVCIPLSAYYAFAPVFVGDSGFKDPGYTMSFGQMSEVFFMLVMPLFFRRLGVKWMLIVGVLAWVVRYGLFSAAAVNQIEWMIFTGILLHGICYDFFFVTGQIYVDEKADVSIRGQAQGFLVLITLGLGMFIGAQVAGQLANRIVTETGEAALAQWQTFWAIPAIGAAVIMVFFAILFKDDGGKNGVEEAGA